MTEHCCCVNENGKKCRRMFVPERENQKYCWQHRKKCKRPQPKCGEKRQSEGQQLSQCKREVAQLKAQMLPLPASPPPSHKRSQANVGNRSTLSFDSNPDWDELILNDEDDNDDNDDNEDEEKETSSKVRLAREASKQLGKGAFGQVFLGVAEVGGKKREVAYKKVPSSLAAEAIQDAKIQSELSRYPACHEYIACIYDSFFDEKRGNYYITIEYIAGQNMFDFSRQNRKLMTNETFLSQCFSDALQGLKYMHERNVAHGDIKLENLMWSINSKNLKFIDFGKGCLFDDCPLLKQAPYGTFIMFPPEFFASVNAQANFANRDVMMLSIGMWLKSPNRRPATFSDLQKVDVWALGYVFFDMMLIGELGRTCDELGLSGRVNDFLQFLQSKKIVLPKKLSFVANAMTSPDPRERETPVGALELLETLTNEDI